MIRTITCRNPNDGLETALYHLKISGIVNDSRNGRVVQAPGPVVTHYTHPRERVMASALRDANPFFHLYESMWMLAGNNSAEQVSHYAANMNRFAEKGIMWGAYGWRWREFFGFDQLTTLVNLLKNDPKTRRAVLTMWAPNGDLIPAEVGLGGLMAADVPCNTQVYFDGTRGVLDMTVCNRSNDIIWGCYGANVVHMSFLQEFMALAVGLPVGAYYQMSNNFHAYLDVDVTQRLLDATPKRQEEWAVRYVSDQRYYDRMPMPYLFMPGSDYRVFLTECEQFGNDPVTRAGANFFLSSIAQPMMAAFEAYKEGELQDAVELMEYCQAVDWRVAGRDWLQRRLDKRKESSV